VTTDALAAGNPGFNKRLAAFLVLGAAFAASFLLYINWRLLFGPVPPGQVYGRDFLIFWHASGVLWQGDFATLFDRTRFIASMDRAAGASTGYSPFSYPPHAIWFIAPLAALPYTASLLTWLAATFALYAAVLRRFFASNWQCLLVLLLSPASLVNVSFGQNGFLVAALLTGALLLLETRPVLAGVLIGILTFKPQLGLLLPFVLIAGGYGRSFLAAAVTGIVLVLASIAIVGIGPWQTFFATGIAAQRHFLEAGEGLYILMVPSFVMAVRILDLPFWLGYALQAIAGIGTLLACCWAIRRSAPHRYKVAAVLAGALFATPYSFNYDMPILAAALVLAWPGARQADWIPYGIAWLLPVLMMPCGLANIPIGPLVLLTTLVFLLYQVARSSRPGMVETPVARAIADAR
jgi:hypothetical protein